jgi:iron complex transport system ATP-binding protein
MSALLEAASIVVRAGGKPLLDGVSLSFERGRTVALVGPNGAGKSTLLRVLSGELKPQSGEVRLRRRKLESYPPQILALHRAVLSQQLNIAFPFTVADVVRMGAGPGLGPQIETLLDTILAELDFHEFADRAITTLSGGEQQRAHFARVLVQLAYGQAHDGSGILLLDEPTANLDLRHQIGILEATRRRAERGALVIAVLHDLNLAARFADHIVVLNQGRIDSEGRPNQTITAATIERVFGVKTMVSQTPPSSVPFVLPQTMTVAERFGTQTQTTGSRSTSYRRAFLPP